MDTLLVSGDHCPDSRGLPVRVTGDEELVQRALIRLSVRRGAFSADPALGSELYRLAGAPQAHLERLAYSYVREALAPMSAVAVEQVCAARTDHDTLLVQVALLTNGRTNRLEVEIP